MRSDLGRLDGVAEILQIGPLLGPLAILGVLFRAIVYDKENAGSIP
jgi:hypothetical protein